MKPSDQELVTRFVDGELKGKELAIFEQRLEIEPDLRGTIDGMQDAKTAPDLHVTRSTTLGGTRCRQQGDPHGAAEVRQRYSLGRDAVRSFR